MCIKVVVAELSVVVTEPREALTVPMTGPVGRVVPVIPDEGAITWTILTDWHVGYVFLHLSCLSAVLWDIYYVL